MTRGTLATINLGALQHNLNRVREAAPGSRILAAIKANGYGHGMVRVARALDEADGFVVACVDEAVQLRQAGVTKIILVLEGMLDHAELEVCSREGLQVAIHHPFQVEMLEAADLDTPLHVWLKVDTGMHRIGLAPSMVGDIYQRLKQCRAVASLRYMTHFACADERNSSMTDEQLRIFSTTCGNDDVEVSLANSAAILGWPKTHGDWVRPGIMLYGASPFPDETGADQGLQPVMTLTTRLISVNHLQAGDAIGYGATWRCPEAMPVGVAAIGYGDGYPRHAPPGTPVLLNNRRVELVGRVSMDMISLDLRSQPDAQVGDSITLWGDGLPVEEVATSAGTISYELLCGVTTRVPFVER